MEYQLPMEGAAGVELGQKAEQWWLDEAAKAGIELALYNSAAPLPSRIAWAQSIGLDVATVLSRFSTKLQHSTESQIQENVHYAARHRMYVPVEFLCVDEAEKGRRQRRDGLERVELILKRKLARVLLVFKVSRLLRVGYKGFQFVNEHVVEEGLRCISVSQGIDTNDEKTWKALMYLHGLMDDMLLDTIADHCRAALSTLFLEGYVTGALPVGYEGQIIEGARLTKRGLPRRKPVIVEATKDLIIKHFEMICGGAPINEGWRQWLAAGGPCDPRSTLGYMSYPAYRRMLSNPRYTGVWAFGRHRNRWSTKRDYTVQVEQPDMEVKIVQCDELRVIPDELFYTAQRELNRHTKGPRGPRSKKSPQLWDLATEFYKCAACSTEKELVRFHQTGAGGHGMRCKRGPLCPSCSAVKRREAALALIAKFDELIQKEVELLDEAKDEAVDLDAQGDHEVEAKLEAAKRKLRVIAAQIDDLTDLAGQGTEEDRAEMKAKIRRVQGDRAAQLAEIATLEVQLRSNSKPLTAKEALNELADCRTLLAEAAAGELGSEGIYKAVSIFRRMVDDRIMVHVARRPGRKQTIVWATFRPRLLRTAHERAGKVYLPDDAECEEVTVWLRKPPKKDANALRTHELIDLQGHSFRSAAKVFQSEGINVNSGVVYQWHARYHEMIGQPVPKRPYNNGEPRKPK